MRYDLCPSGGHDEMTQMDETTTAIYLVRNYCNDDAYLCGCLS